MFHNEKNVLYYNVNIYNVCYNKDKARIKITNLENEMRVT